MRAKVAGKRSAQFICSFKTNALNLTTHIFLDFENIAPWNQGNHPIIATIKQRTSEILLRKFIFRSITYNNKSSRDHCTD